MQKCLVIIMSIMLTASCSTNHDFQEIKVHYASLSELFKSFDKSILVSNDEFKVKRYLITKNKEIVNYLSAKYPQFGDISMVDVNDPNTILFALTYLVMEENKFKPLMSSLLQNKEGSPSANRLIITRPVTDTISNHVVVIKPALPSHLDDGIPAWLQCSVDIIMGYFDIRSIIKGLGTFEFGSVWTVVKFAIEKYVGWVAAAILIYDITTNCILSKNVIGIDTGKVKIDRDSAKAQLGILHQ